MLAKDAAKIFGITERTFREKWVKKYNIRFVIISGKGSKDYNNEDIITLSKKVFRKRRNNELLIEYLDTLNDEQKELYYKHKEEQLEKQRAYHRVENMTAEQHEKEKARRRVENMTPEQHEKILAKNRVANMTPEQIEKRNARTRIKNLTPEQIERRHLKQREKRNSLTPYEKEKLRAKYRVENMTKERHEKEKARSRKRNTIKKIQFRKLLKDNGYEKCVITGLTCDETVIDYHHVEHTNKLGEISQLINHNAYNQKTKEMVLEEAKKCIPLAKEIHKAYHCGNEQVVKVVNNYIYEHFGIIIPVKEFSKYAKRKRKYRKENIEYLKNIGYSLVCPFTGKSIDDIGGIEFHHINPNEKTFQVCKLIIKAPTPENQKILLDEINKCIPLAPYIHQIYHNKNHKLHKEIKNKIDEYLAIIN